MQRNDKIFINQGFLIFIIILRRLKSQRIDSTETTIS